MGKRGRGDQQVGTFVPKLRGQTAPAACHAWRNRQDPICVKPCQTLKPGCQRVGEFRITLAPLFHAALNFAKCDNAEMQLILLLLRDPANQPDIRPLLSQLGDDYGTH